MADFEEAGDNDVLRKVAQGSSTPKASPSSKFARKMNELLAQAVEQIKTERLTCRLLPSPGACAPAKRSTPAGA